jgi:hypothetical protein
MRLKVGCGILLFQRGEEAYRLVIVFILLLFLVPVEFCKSAVSESSQLESKV